MKRNEGRSCGFTIRQKFRFLHFFQDFPLPAALEYVSLDANKTFGCILRERESGREKGESKRESEREAKSNPVWIYSLRRNKSRSDLNCSAASPENSAFSSFCAKIRSFHFEGRRVSVSLSRLISLSDRILVAEWQKKKIET